MLSATSQTVIGSPPHHQRDRSGHHPHPTHLRNPEKAHAEGACQIMLWARPLDAKSDLISFLVAARFGPCSIRDLFQTGLGPDLDQIELQPKTLIKSDFPSDGLVHHMTPDRTSLYTTSALRCSRGPRSRPPKSRPGPCTREWLLNETHAGLKPNGPM